MRASITSISHGGDHLFQAGPFQRRVGIVLPTRKVGRRQPQFGQPRSVGAAADDRPPRSSAQAAQRFFGKGHGPRLARRARRPDCDIAAGTSTLMRAPGYVGLGCAGPIVRADRACSASCVACRNRAATRAACLGHAPFDDIGVQESLAVAGRFGRQPVARQARRESRRPRATALTIRPLAIEGWMFTPRIVTIGQVGRKCLDVDFVGPLAVERVGRDRARARPDRRGRRRGRFLRRR